jgi:hypothetical protein
MPKGKKDKYERLRKAAADAEDRLRDAGSAAGEQWALDHASPAELERLQQARDSGRLWYDAFGVPGSHVVRIYRAITGEHDEVVWDDAVGFWDFVLGPDAESIHDDRFAAAFVYGALAAYAEAKRVG